MKHIFAAIFAVMIAMLSVPALAAAEPIAEQNCISVSEAALSPKLYPAEVITKEQNGTFYLEKMYILSASDDPADIDTADCVRDGRTYKLLDVLKNDMT